jgi:hypothetical protein
MGLRPVAEVLRGVVVPVHFLPAFLAGEDGCLGQVPTNEGSPVCSIACWIANSCNPADAALLDRIRSELQALERRLALAR